jgi:hypothetical protein
MRPGFSCTVKSLLKSALDRAMDSARARDLRSEGYRCQAASGQKQASKPSPGMLPRLRSRRFTQNAVLLNRIRLMLAVQSLLQKYFPSRLTQITFKTAPSCPAEGRWPSSRTLGRDAVDANHATDESVCLRTAKSCGPDAPTLASSWRKVFRRRQWQESPVTGESAK